MPKPAYQHTCACGYRTNRSWKFIDHKKVHEPKKKGGKNAKAK